VNIESVNAANQPVFSEKLLPSFWAFVMAAIVFPSVYLVFLPINELFGLSLGAGLTLLIWAILVAVSVRIEVANDELRVGAAHIPLIFLADAHAIAPENAFSERGPKLDSRAFVRFQMGVKTLVRFENIDEADPAPYWLLSTRKPEQLIAAVERARAAA
jgi:Protein of unknown function (DUF3093)